MKLEFTTPVTCHNFNQYSNKLVTIYQACFSNLSQFQSISLTKFEEVQKFTGSSIQQHKYTNV